MYTSINEWKHNLTKKGFIKEGKLAEDFDGNVEDADFLPAEEDGVEEIEDGGIVSFETFKDAVLTEYENSCNLDTDTEENDDSDDNDDESVEESNSDEGRATCQMLDEEQLKIAYDAFLTLTTDNGSETEDEEDSEEEIEEIEEGIGSFLKGGTKEELGEKKKAIISQLKDIENKYKDKEIVFKEYGDNKNVAYNKENVLKIINKNNFLGKIQIVDKKDKVFLIYREGKKGVNKIANATTPDALK